MKEGWASVAQILRVSMQALAMQGKNMWDTDSNSSEMIHKRNHITQKFFPSRYHFRLITQPQQTSFRIRSLYCFSIPIQIKITVFYPYD